jgi:hypothetical protein
MHYNKKLREMRDKLNQLRINFFSYEHSIEKEFGTGDNHQNDRYKLMNNHEEINKHGNQIEDIKKTGMETVAIMR